MSKITQLTEATNPSSGDDLVEIVIDTATTPVNRKMKFLNLLRRLFLGDGTQLTVTTIADGEFLKRSGTNILGASPGGGGLGDVIGPASATDEAVARYNLTTGKLIQDSVVTINDVGAVTVPEIAAPATPASGKAVIYVKADGKLYIKDDTGAETDLTATGSVTFPLLAPDGSQGAPSYSFTNSPDSGVFILNGTPDHLRFGVGNKEHLDMYQGTGAKPVLLLNLNTDNRLGWGNGSLRSGLADGGKGSVKFISDEAGTPGCGYSVTADLVDVGGTRAPWHTAGQNFRHILTGNRTIGPPKADGGSSSNDGVIITIELVQDGTGSRTVTWDSGYKFIGGVVPTLSTAAGAVDIFVFKCNASNQAFQICPSALDVK